MEANAAVDVVAVLRGDAKICFDRSHVQIAFPASPHFAGNDKSSRLFPAGVAGGLLVTDRPGLRLVYPSHPFYAQPAAASETNSKLGAYLPHYLTLWKNERAT